MIKALHQAAEFPEQLPQSFRNLQLGLKLGWTEGGDIRFWPIAGAAVAMVASGGLLMLAQRTIPLGTAYAVWTGIGAAGTFVVGITLFHEPAQWGQVGCVALIVAGVIGLKLLSPH